MFEELDMVETVSPIAEQNIPAGAVGTVLLVFGKHEAYEDEFPVPGEEFETNVVTLTADQVRPVSPRASAASRKSA
jgi:hypothetical protein